MTTPNTIAARSSGQETGATGCLDSITIDTPLNDPELGARYCLVALRHLRLAPGPLIVLSALLALRRKTCILEISLADLANSLTFSGVTVAMHVAELRARGLVSPDALKASPSAVTKPGERFARCKVDKIAVCSPAAWRLYVAARLFTDAKGRLRVSRRYLAEAMARTTRTLRRLLALLREAGISIGKRLFSGSGKSVRSTRRKASANHKRGIKTGGFNPESLKVKSPKANYMSDRDRDAEIQRQRRMLAQLLANG